MKPKLKSQHKHVFKLISRDAGEDGWVSVSEVLFPHLSENIPKELATFEKLEVGGRAKLTEEGKNIITAMEWLIEKEDKCEKP